MPDAPPTDAGRAWLPASLAAAATTTLAGLLVDGRTPGADTVFWAPGAVNGAQLADLPIVAVGLVGLAACALTLHRRTSPARVAAGAAALVLSLLAATLLKGDGPDSGRSLVALTGDIGVNTGDLPVLAVWLVGVVPCVLLLRRRRAPHVSDPPRTLRP